MTYAHDLQRRIELKRKLGTKLDDLLNDAVKQDHAGRIVRALNRKFFLSRATAFIKTGNKVV